MFEVKDDFYLNGEKFQIISGAVHYFRTVPEYWQDRLEKLINCGCNTVETYIPWNFHEPEKGKFRWDGMHDVIGFIELAEKMGLYIIIRPSPYICSEWEYGGMPAWLLKDKGMHVRCSYKPYLDAVRDYYKVLIPMLKPHQITEGGKIILMQIENEYGYYGNDTAYMEFLRDTMREFGVSVPLVTSDGPFAEKSFVCGKVEGALQTGNFGSNGEHMFSEMKRLGVKDQPCMCMEFWNGWFDAWGEEHHVTKADVAAKELDELLKRGHANFYMFEGGTNFGWMSGRNFGNQTADVTSYDYDAPLTDDGQITEKYKLCKEVISKYRKFNEIPLSMDIKRKAYGKVDCNAVVGLQALVEKLEKLGEGVKSPWPLSFEELESYYGYVLYRARINDGVAVKELRVENVADRAQGFVNGKHGFTAFAENINEKFELKENAVNPVIDVLVENIGRENFGANLDLQRKGLMGGLKVNEVRHFGYEMFPLAFDEAQFEKVEALLEEAGKSYSREDFNPAACMEKGEPLFMRFSFDVAAGDRCDTFLETEGFGKGVAFINGFNLGRFWDKGPQQRLYIPGPLLREGKNSLVIFETEGKVSKTALLTDKGTWK